MQKSCIKQKSFANSGFCQFHILITASNIPAKDDFETRKNITMQIVCWIRKFLMKH